MDQDIAQKQQLEGILEQARASISDFCQTECDDSCCNRNYLKIKDPEVIKLMYNISDIDGFEDPLDRLVSKEFFLDDNHFVLYLTPCPQLDNNQCQIYDNSKRPQVCKDYPIFKTKSEIIFAKSCPAVNLGVLKNYEEAIQNLGYTIAH